MMSSRANFWPPFYTKVTMDRLRHFIATIFGKELGPPYLCNRLSADVGGFAVPIVRDFHKIFANAGSAYLEYETAGDLHYNPTGLIRVHLKNSKPQLGPSDGVVHAFDPKTKEDLGGENLCIGPGWK